MAEFDRVERLTDLVLVLLNARRPLTLEEIARDVPGYPAGHAARRQAFERDKRLLREEGVPLLTEPLDDPSQYGYRIDPDRYYLPPLDLDPRERTALHLAVAGVHLGDSSGREALVKLGAGASEPVTQAAVQASVEAHPYLAPLFEALRTGARLGFTYRGRERSVSPAGLWFRRGRWYLVAWDHGHDEGRTFRVDRIEEPPTLAEPGTATVPEDFDAAGAVPGAPWRVGEAEEVTAVLDVDPVEAPSAVGELGAGTVMDARPDGSVRLALEVTNFGALRSWLMGLLDHAELVDPPEWRAAVVEWLTATAEWPGASHPGADGRAPAAKGAPAGSPRGHSSSPPEASLRLQRLLAMMGWLAGVGQATLAELAARFQVTEDEVVRELELAACCGLPPYTPDVLMEIVVTDGRVEARLPEALARPRPLSPAQGVALVAAARTILAIPGSDPDGLLASALAKLEKAVGEHRGLEIDLDEPPALGEVRRGVDEGRRLELTYHAASTDRTSTRSVDPVRVASIDGHWYLDAHDVALGATRRFRVDRIREVVVTDGPAAVPADRRAEAAPGPAFVPGPDARAVRLRLAPSASWVTEAVDVHDVTALDGGWQEVGLFVGGTAWLERLLLQLGPDGYVVEPPEWRGLGPEAAHRVLQRYRG